MSYEKGHNPLAIANFFIDLSNGRGLSLVQIIKLSYIAHGFKLGFKGYPLANEYVEAWKLGPVFSKIYNEFKRSGINIKEPAKRLKDNFKDLEVIRSKFNEEEKSIMEKVFKVYGSKTAVDLIAITHKKGSPWDKAWNDSNGKEVFNFQIKNKDIQEYYENKIKEVQVA